MGWEWHQLDQMQIICTSLQTGNHASISSHSFTGRMLFLTPNQQCQSIESMALHIQPAPEAVWRLDGKVEKPAE